MASTLDTLELAKDLRASDFSERQAEGLARALRRTREFDLADLSTKNDIALLKTDLALLKAEMLGEISKLRGDIDTKFADLKGEIARSKNGMLMWLLPLLFGQVGALVLLILRTP
mgnify:CR=1 FL=1